MLIYFISREALLVSYVCKVNCPCPEQGQNLNSQLSSAIG